MYSTKCRKIMIETSFSVVSYFDQFDLSSCFGQWSPWTSALRRFYSICTYAYVSVQYFRLMQRNSLTKHIGSTVLKPMIVASVLQWVW